VYLRSSILLSIVRMSYANITKDPVVTKAFRASMCDVFQGLLGYWARVPAETYMSAADLQVRAWV
jgi:hypothetical protein